MIIGNPSPWRARFNQLEKKFSERIKKIWPDCSVLVHSDSQENRITNILVHSLQKDKIARKLGLIVPQYTLLEEEQIGDVVTKGIIDFAVFIHKDHERYIAFECKRLNVSFTSGKKSLALDYVNEGMMRYISAQYAKNLPLGVMLGYVMDGDLDDFVNGWLQAGCPTKRISADDE